MSILGAIALFCVVWGMALMPIMILKMLDSQE